MEGPCYGCPRPPIPRDQVGKGLLSLLTGDGAGSHGQGDALRGAGDGQGVVTCGPGCPGQLSPPGPLCCPLSGARRGQAGSAMHQLPPTPPDPTQVVGLILHPTAPALSIPMGSPHTPRAEVTVAEAEGTRCAPARLPAPRFQRQLRAEQPQRYCLGFCDQTRSRRYLPAALRRHGQEAQLHRGGCGSWGGTAVAAPDAAPTLAGTFPRAATQPRAHRAHRRHGCPRQGALPGPGVHVGFSPCPAATLGRRNSPRNYPWIIPQLPRVTPHLPGHCLQKAFCESRIPKQQILL